MAGISPLTFPRSADDFPAGREIPRHLPAVAAIVEVLLELHSTLCVKTAAGAALEVDELHDLRVTLRRSRSLLRGFRDVLGRDRQRHFGAEFRWLGAATSRLRDLDVLQAALREPAAAHATLVTLTAEDHVRLGAFLETERQRDAERLARVLNSPRFARLCRAWPAALVTLPHPPDHAAPRLGVAVDTALRRAVARLRRDVTELARQRTPSALHELRKQCKRLRYLVEPFTSLYPQARIDTLLSDLKRLQTMMGEICDRHAQRALIGGHLWCRARGDPALRAALQRLRKALREQAATTEVSTVLAALAEFDAGRHLADMNALFGTLEP